MVGGYATVDWLSNNVFGRFKQFGKILKKVAERSHDSGWGHATVGRLSNNVFGCFKQLEFFLKSLNGHATVVGGHATIGRLSNNVFSTFKANRKFWKKSLNGHVTVVGGHATVSRLSNSDFLTFQAIRNFFEKSRWTVTRQWSEVTRPSADCQTTFFGRFKRFGRILKKVAERSRDSGWGHATVGRLSNNVFWTFQAIWENFEKSRWMVTRQWLRSRDRRPTVKQRFLDVSSDLGKFWKKSLKGHSTVVEVTRPSADCQTTFYGRFKQLEIFLKKVAERSRDSGRRSRNRRLTVKQRFWTFQAIRKLFVKTHRRVTRQWSVVTRLSADCQAHICMYIIINERERQRESERETRERESEKERERERDRERERERERERDRIQKSGSEKLPRQFSRLLTPVPSLSVFHGNLPQQIRDTTSPMFIMGNLFPSWGINELEFSRQNLKFSSSHP